MKLALTFNEIGEYNHFVLKEGFEYVQALSRVLQPGRLVPDNKEGKGLFWASVLLQQHSPVSLEGSRVTNHGLPSSTGRRKVETETGGFCEYGLTLTFFCNGQICFSENVQVSMQNAKMTFQEDGKEVPYHLHSPSLQI